MNRWIAGARPRTLPNSIVPVLVGTGVAAGAGGENWPRAAFALLVAVLLQIGVNYANDYSDGVRGTDSSRIGPTRLVGSGTVPANRVLAAALACFGAATVAGLVLVLLTRAWWLLAVGAVAIAAAWFYTGGPRPYGYRALGEISVFVFFGLVAVMGTAYVQLERLPWVAAAAALPVGLLSCAVLITNNLRDIPTDSESGKRTLAVVLGDQRTRLLYVVCLVVPFAAVIPLALARPWTLLALLSIPLVVLPIRLVRHGAVRQALIPVLDQTGRLQLVYGLLLAAGLALPTA